MPVADAHLHLFAEGFAGIKGGPPAGADELAAYERLRQVHGIARALVVGYEGEPRYAGNNDYVLDLARNRRWIAPLAYVPVHSPPSSATLAELRRRGAVGLAVYATAASDGSALAGWPPTVLAELRAQRAIVSLNARPAATACLGDFVDALHPAPVLFSHLGLPGTYDGIATHDAARAALAPLLAVADRDHVAVKLSGLYSVGDPATADVNLAAQPFVDALLAAFGTARLVWGSDFSPALDYVSFAQTLDMSVLGRCAPAEIDAVLGGNLMRLLSDSTREE